MPGERNQLLLAHLYARNGAGRLALGAGSDLETFLTALSHFGVPERRTRELRDLAVRSAGVDSDQLLALLAGTTCQLVTDALRDPRCLDAELIDRLDDAVSDVDRQCSVPFVRLQLLLAPIVEVCLRLRSPEPTAQRDRVQRGIAGADLTIGRLRGGDVRAATALLHECVQTTAATGGRVAAQRIGHARRELAAWRDEALVTELDDHIFDTLVAT